MLLPSRIRLTIIAVYRLIPETKGRSLEEMDVIFGSVTAEQRQKHIQQEERGQSFSLHFRLVWFGFVSHRSSSYSPRARAQRHDVRQVPGAQGLSTNSVTYLSRPRCTLLFRVPPFSWHTLVFDRRQR